MNIGKREMGKSEEAKVIEIMEDLNGKERMYRKMKKSDLINILTMRDLLDESFDEPEGNDIKLWCYVSDWTGGKYLTNEMPRKYISYGRSVYLSDGEVNIRIPKCMEGMFPDLKYEDEPVRINLSTSF